jgi:MFS family permease
MKKPIAMLALLLFAAFVAYVFGIVFYAVILFALWTQYGWQWGPLLQVCTWFAAAVVLGILITLGASWATKVLSAEFDMLKKQP